jgi:hypothetical protein
LFSIRYGPGPFQPAIACVSTPVPWMPEIYELRIWVSPLFPRHAVDVAAVDDEVLRHHRQRILAAVAAAELEQVGARRRLARQDLDRLQAPVGRARRRAERGAVVIRAHLGQQARVRRIDPRPRRRQRRIRSGRSNRDVGAAALGRQEEIAGEHSTGRQQDRVTRLGGIDGGLQVASGRYADGSRPRGRRERQHTRTRE